jgi:hypothetical protein
MPVLHPLHRVYRGRIRGELRFAATLLHRLQVFSDRHPASGLVPPPLSVANYNKCTDLIVLFEQMLAQVH